MTVLCEEPPECDSCSTRVTNYTPEFVKQLTNEFSKLKDFQIFLMKYNENPDLVNDLCEKCRITKWRNLKHTNYNPARQQNRTADNLMKSLFSFKSGLIIAALLVGVLSKECYNFYAITGTNTNGLSEDKLKSTMMSLKNHFPSLQQSMIKKLGGAFSRLRSPGEPIVFMLLHNDANKQTTDCLASYASISAKQHIFTNSKDGLWLNGSEWTSYSDIDSEDLLYEKLNAPLEKNEVLVLENLQDLPWSLAKSLHHLCDSENPKIAKAMYMLELRVNRDLQQLSESDKLVAAEQAMNIAWQDAPNEFRAPLIARLTSFVDTVQWESDEACLGGSFIRISP